MEGWAIKILMGKSILVNFHFPIGVERGLLYPRNGTIHLAVG
jgi:hypothetical protein